VVRASGYVVNKKAEYGAKMEKRNIKSLMIFVISIVLLSYGFTSTETWCGMIMSIGIIFLAVSLNSFLEELVGKDTMKYVWYCWILVMVTILLGEEGLAALINFFKS